MKRDLYLIETIEGCAVLPDFYTDPNDGLVKCCRRAPRARGFRADYRQLKRWFVILMVALLVVAFGARYGYERMKAERDQARAELEAVRKPAVMVSCTPHGETPVADTAITESCIGTRYRF